MSTAAQAAPTKVRTASSPRRQSGTSHPELLPRSLSAASRNGTPSSLPRSNPNTNAHSGPSPAPRHANLANMAGRDVEQTNLASTSNQRSSSRDARDSYNGETAETTRGSRPPSSRSRPNRYNSDNTIPAPPATNGAISGQGTKAPPTTTSASRRRTTVTAQTGQWTLGKTIGQGSMGKVKLATNLETGEQVAIKIVPRQSQDEHRSQQDRERADRSKEVRTAREAAIVTLVDHPYICGMRDVVRTNHHWYMLFEYVNGGQMLDYIISHGRLKEKQARKFGRQIASALDYCHRNSIVHRDLKIENILISKDGNIKIIDFGLSNLFSPRSVLKTFCGSLYFAAPELLQAKAYTGPEVDVWSFGIVLYVLVCGKVPFDDQSMPQLHAKIKKGVVEYPAWLSAECKHIISRMLVTDPRSRATLVEIMNHPWLTKGFNGPPENCLPHREPLQLPLDPKVIEKMTGFDFGSGEYITNQLESLIKSEDYQRALYSAAHKPQGASDSERNKGGMFGFYQRRKSTVSRDTLTQPSAEAVNLGEDPINAFSPLISIYYLAREKREREKVESNPGGLSMPQSPGEKPLRMPGLPAPEAAHTNAAAFELAGETPTGGRSRPRARTHGEDEVAEKAVKLKVPGATTPTKSVLADTTPVKKESAVEGLLRRFSTRRGRNTDREKSSPQPPPVVAVSEPEGPPQSPTPTEKRVVLRKTRDRVTPPSAYEKYANNPELLAPPSPSESPARKLMGLARSTSVNSADLRRRWSRRGTSGVSIASSTGMSDTGEKPDASLAVQANSTGDVLEKSELPHRPRVAASRAKSLGHARKESIQARRADRERTIGSEVPEETDQELAEDAAVDSRTDDTAEFTKPVYLKGLFSVSTTSSKPLSFIREDLIRVLKHLDVDYRTIKGGFSCRSSPSIELNQAVENPPSESRPNATLHRRRISFAGLRGADREREEHNEQQRPRTPVTPRPLSRQPALESTYTNSDDSDEDVARHHSKSPRAPGETSTHVQSDMGQSKILKFEILVVKVPLLSLHGLQFKKVEGNTWQYRHLADTILQELRL